MESGTVEKNISLFLLKKLKIALERKIGRKSKRSLPKYDMSRAGKEKLEQKKLIMYIIGFVGFGDETSLFSEIDAFLYSIFYRMVYKSSVFPTIISYFSRFQFLGKDGENFDMEKFYEDMTDSEDENDYHNDNESVRGRDDYYKEINFVRKVSQNFSWGK